MQPIAAHVLQFRRLGGQAEKRGEVLDLLHIVMLGFRCELADHHVFDHASAQWAGGLIGHWDAPVLNEVVETPQSQDSCPVPLLRFPCRRRSALPRERFSPVTHCRSRNC
jgi:hypothetical protein